MVAGDMFVEVFEHAEAVNDLVYGFAAVKCVENVGEPHVVWRVAVQSVFEARADANVPLFDLWLFAATRQNPASANQRVVNELTREMVAAVKV
ncbi:MAG: hypothetical protein DRO65_01780 [Candidatus Altiarchaeales archaeon]|nr:MAG: hypothetical protein DRO65_01780 [Candidatus Altiarchaeales archaeon]